MKLNIILPSRNEELLMRSAIVDFYRYLRKKGYLFEILGVINGSTGDTEKIDGKLSERHNEIKKCKSKTGYGYTLKKRNERVKREVFSYL